MHRNRLIIIIFSITSLLSILPVCASAKTASPSWQSAMQTVLDRYSNTAQQSLEPVFRRVGSHYPPRDIALLAFKDEAKMELWAKYYGAWQHIKDYPLTARSGKPGPKLKQNDHQIPEGIYRITAFNPFSRLHLSLKINYPNALDRYFAKRDGRKRLGGNIFIHGKNLSAGCLAIGDKAIEELFVLVHAVGKRHTTVIIASNDLRRGRPVNLSRRNPVWVRYLNYKLVRALRPFHATV